MRELHCRNTLEDVAYEISKDPFFVEKWSYVAHHLGYGWCAGTGSEYVGKDFSSRRISPLTYKTSANFNPDHPKPDSHPLWDTRLNMTFSDFNFHIPHNKIRFSEPEIRLLEPQYSGTLEAINYSNEETTANFNITSTLTNSVTHTTSHNLKHGYNLKQKWTAGIPGLGAAETEMQITFEATHGWSDATMDLNTISSNSTSTITLAPRTRKSINLYMMKTQNKVSYHAYALYEYHVTLNGFLRYNWNARRHENGHHVLGRPIETYTFGTEQLNAIEHLVDSSSHWYINNYDPVWAWDACRIPTAENDSRCIFQSIDKLQNNPPAKKITGVFKNVYGTRVQSTFMPSEVLTPDEMSQFHRQQRNGIVLGNSNRTFNPSNQIRVSVNSPSNLCFFQSSNQARRQIAPSQCQQSSSARANRHEIVWTEGNGNHCLRSDGIIIRGHSIFDRQQSRAFIREHHLETRLSR